MQRCAGMMKALTDKPLYQRELIQPIGLTDDGFVLPKNTFRALRMIFCTPFEMLLFFKKVHIVAVRVHQIGPLTHKYSHTNTTGTDLDGRVTG